MRKGRVAIENKEGGKEGKNHHAASREERDVLRAEREADGGMLNNR
jgi:hypothetical protein